jgi:prevent-host-death family protein
MKTKYQTISASKARRDFGKLLKKVSKGYEIEITYRGRPVAQIKPTLAPKKWNPTVFDRILAFRGSIKPLPKGETGKDLINAGRRL